MAGSVIFSFRHQNRFLNKTHPFVKVLALLSGCMVLLQGSFYLVAIIGVFLIIVAVGQRLPLASYARQLRFFVILFLLIATGEYLQSRSMSLALIALLRYALMILFALLVTDSTSSDEIASSIPFINKTFLASGIELTLAIVPMIFLVSEEVQIAQRARLKKWTFKSTFEYLSTIFELLLLRLEEQTYALEGRLFDAKRRRTALPLTWYDLPLIIATVTFISLRIIG